MQTHKVVSRLAASLTLVNAAASAIAALPNGVSAGDVDQDSAVLWARTDVSGSLSFELSVDPAFGSTVSAGSTTIGDTSLPAKFNPSGLTAGTQYYYRFTDSSGATQTGSFRTPAAAGVQSGFRFGVSGDWRGELSPYPAIRNIPSRNLDLFVKLGDTVYADVPSPDLNQPQAFTISEYRTKHNEVYGTRSGANYWADAQRTTAVLSTIDDHEVTNDFQGFQTVADAVAANPSTPLTFGGPAGTTRINDTPLYDNGMQAFEEYNALETRRWANTGTDPRMDGEIDLYRSQTYGKDAAVIVTDARSFRDAGLPAADPLNPASVTNFLVNSFDPTRTMLGKRQVNQLKADLLNAQSNGVTWKFVNVPEPIQNFGVLGASDRFEGYAAERTEILKFIDDNNIDNVVFVAADIHGTVVNNLTYQLGPGQPQIPTNSFEITTGSVAYDAPFGPTVYNIALGLGVVPPALQAAWNSGDPATREFVLQTLINGQTAPLGYEPVGLDGSGLNATLLAGSYSATQTFGWTEFNIDPNTQELLVTTWGIPAYTANTIGGSLSAQPQIVSQFRVAPIPEPSLVGALTLSVWALRRRRDARV